MARRKMIILTGGPGGGKTTLINELLHDPAWQSRIAALPEAISLMGGMRISPSEQLFQRIMVHMEMALEDGLANALEVESRHFILCHRGSLDPLAYWLDRGWGEQEFFEYTQTTREAYYRRYAAVIHLVTAADGAEQAYQRWSQAHRPEIIEDAIRIDRLLQQVWRGHPNYVCIDNLGRDWPAKSREARVILERLWVAHNVL